jgi:hypothetical protein
MNLGSLYIQFAVLKAKLVLRGTLSLPCIRRYKCISKTRHLFTGDLLMNDVLEFLFSAYTEILFALALQSQHLDWSDYTNYAPLISWIIFVVLAVGLPIWLTYFLNKNRDRLHEDWF